MTFPDGIGTVDELLDRLATPDLRADEAEALIAQLDGQEAAALPAVFRRLHDAPTEEELHAAVRVLARWVDRPVAAALPPALRVLLGESAVGDLNKLAAADLLRDLGQPVDDDALVGFLRDPEAVAVRALAAAIDASRRPAALANTLDSVSHMPAAHVRSLVDDIRQMGGAHAGHLLAALTHHADEDVSVSAVAAIDVLGLADARELLSIAAERHPSALVREQAELTLLRLPDAGGADAGGSDSARPGTGTAPGHPGSATMRQHASDREDARAQVYLSRGGAEIGCFAILALACDANGRHGRHTEDHAEGRASHALYDVLTVHFHEDAGVRQYAAAELASTGDIAELLEKLASAGVEAAPASTGAVRAALREASGESLAAGSAALGYLAWPAFLTAFGTGARSSWV